MKKGSFGKQCCKFKLVSFPAQETNVRNFIFRFEATEYFLNNLISSCRIDNYRFPKFNPSL